MYSGEVLGFSVSKINKLIDTVLKLEVLLQLLIQVKSIDAHQQLQLFQRYLLRHIVHIRVAVLGEETSQESVVNRLQKLHQVILLAVRLGRQAEVVTCALDECIVDLVVGAGE